MDKNLENSIYQNVLNCMTPEQKLQAFTNLYWTARALKAAGLRSQFPGLKEEEIQKKVRDIFLYAND